MSARALLVTAVVLVAACGRAGPPVAPERVTPMAVSDVRGVVVDRTIELAWTLPSHRADNARLRDLAVVHVFRAEDEGAGDPKPAIVSRGRVAGYAEVATVRLADPAPAQLSAGRMTLVDRTTLTPGRRYTYVVLAEDARGHVSPPSERLSVTLIAPPAPPAGLQAAPGDREVRVSWQPAGEPLVYEVLRAAGADDPMDVLAITAAGATSFVDRTVDNDRAYAYAVRAQRTAQGSLARSAPSARVTATPVDTTPPRPPAEVVAVPSEGVVRLVWTASPDADVARYIVYRGREGGGALARVGSTAVPGTTFTDREVPAGRWRYAVSAEDNSSRANESGRSAEVTVSVP